MGHLRNEWPELIVRERIRVLAALFPDAVYGYRSAFDGGVPVDGVAYLTHTYSRTVLLPGLTISVLKGRRIRLVTCRCRAGRSIFLPSLGCCWKT